MYRHSWSRSASGSTWNLVGSTDSSFRNFIPERSSRQITTLVTPIEQAAPSQKASSSYSLRLIRSSSCSTACAARYWSMKLELAPQAYAVIRGSAERIEDAFWSTAAKVQFLTPRFCHSVAFLAAVFAGAFQWFSPRRNFQLS